MPVLKVKKNGIWEPVSVSTSITPDYNQNDSTASDYIKNRPFYTGEGLVNTWTFDGNLDNTEHITDPTQDNSYFVKASDIYVEPDSLLGSTITYTYFDGEEYTSTLDTIQDMTEMIGIPVYVINGSILCLPNDAPEFNATAGIYAWYGVDRRYVSRIDANQPIFETEVVHKLDTKYLPEGGFGWTEKGELTNIWEFDDSLENVEYYQVGENQYYIRVLNTYQEPEFFIGVTCEVNSDGYIENGEFTEDMIEDVSAQTGFPAYIIQNQMGLVLSQEYNGIPEGFYVLYIPNYMFVQKITFNQNVIGESEIIHKIYQKYIPNADWNINDSNTDGYIENRPFFESPDGEIKKLDEKFLPKSIPLIQSAGVGQYIRIKNVDSNGKPTEYEAATVQSSSGVGQLDTGIGAEIFNIHNGNRNLAEGDYSHAEGSSSKARGDYSHAEGFNANATGKASHAEGNWVIASGKASHAEGGSSSVGVGITLEASGDYSHAEGECTQASGQGSHAEGFHTGASGEYSHAEGYESETTGEASHAEGSYTVATGEASHAEGSYTVAIGYSSHAEGNSTVALGEYSHAEGYGFTYLLNISGEAGATTYSFYNGSVTKIFPSKEKYFVIYGEKLEEVTEVDITNQTFTVRKSLSENEALNSVAVKLCSSGLAAGNYSHAAGRGVALSDCSSAMGIGTIADSKYLNVCGSFNKYSLETYTIDEETVSRFGYSSSIFGREIESYSFDSEQGNFIVSGLSDNSTSSTSVSIGKLYVLDSRFFNGEEIITDADGTTRATVIGKVIDFSTSTNEITYVKYKIDSSYNCKGKYINIVGNGSYYDNRSNAHTLDWDGNAWYQGDVYVGGTSQDDGERLARLSDIPEAQVQADWSQTDETAVDFIKNKPDEADALALVAELGFVEPVAADDGSIYTDENGAVYTLI